MNREEKCLFFGFDIQAPWPEHHPKGRILEEKDRHLTVAFLGNNKLSNIEPLLKNTPLPPFTLGLIGKFDQILFLPSAHPRVVAWHIHWLSEDNPLCVYQRKLQQWLIANDVSVKSHEQFLPHVTISRSPFHAQSWEKSFAPIPFFTGSFHLFESLGSSHYASLWSYPMKPPFEEIEHTADIGYLIYGNTIDELFQHAQIALCFSFPPLLTHTVLTKVNNVEDMVMVLNQIVTRADQDIGCPFKAVSFHGKIHTRKSLLQWEMIVDV